MRQDRLIRLINMNQVRARVGMLCGIQRDDPQEKLRKRIRNERRMTLCFEDHPSFFDERRWKLFMGRLLLQRKLASLQTGLQHL